MKRADLIKVIQDRAWETSFGELDLAEYEAADILDSLLKAGMRLPSETPEVKTINQLEAECIQKQLEASGWDLTKTAMDLGIGRATLYRKIKQYGLERKS